MFPGLSTLTTLSDPPHHVLPRIPCKPHACPRGEVHHDARVIAGGSAARHDKCPCTPFRIQNWQMTTINHVFSFHQQCPNDDDTHLFPAVRFLSFNNDCTIYLTGSLQPFFCLYRDFVVTMPFFYDVDGLSTRSVEVVLYTDHDFQLEAKPPCSGNNLDAWDFHFVTIDMIASTASVDT